MTQFIKIRNENENTTSKFTEIFKENTITISNQQIDKLDKMKTFLETYKRSNQHEKIENVTKPVTNTKIE